MPGKKLLLPLTFGDPTLPKLPTIDPIETPGNGSLLLVEPQHPAGPWTAGVPASGFVIPNLLRDKAAAMTGQTAASMDGSFVTNPGTTNAVVSSAGAVVLGTTQGLIERSGKGGLHMVASKSTPGTFFAKVRMGGQVYAWLYNNPGHYFYHSQWFRITRAHSGPDQSNTNSQRWGEVPKASFFNDSGSLLVKTNAVTTVEVAGKAGGRNGSGGLDTTSTTIPWTAGQTGPMFRNVSGVLFDPTTASVTPVEHTGVGQWDSNNQKAGNIGQNGSMILYRSYIEDLTVSGRSLAEVDAIDMALYTKHVLTSGGRYFGDTFSAPATVLP